MQSGAIITRLEVKFPVSCLISIRIRGSAGTLTKRDPPAAGQLSNLFHRQMQLQIGIGKSASPVSNHQQRPAFGKRYSCFCNPACPSLEDDQTGQICQMIGIRVDDVKGSSGISFYGIRQVVFAVWSLPEKAKTEIFLEKPFREKPDLHIRIASWYRTFGPGHRLSVMLHILRSLSA